MWGLSFTQNCKFPNESILIHRRFISRNGCRLRKMSSTIHDWASNCLSRLISAEKKWLSTLHPLHYFFRFVNRPWTVMVETQLAAPSWCTEASPCIQSGLGWARQEYRHSSPLWNRSCGYRLPCMQTSILSKHILLPLITSFCASIGVIALNKGHAIIQDPLACPFSFWCWHVREWNDVKALGKPDIQ